MSEARPRPPIGSESRVSPAVPAPSSLRPASPSPSRPKRPLSSPVGSASASKRANSEDLMDHSTRVDMTTTTTPPTTTSLATPGDLDGSTLGTSRLHIASTPTSNSGESTPPLLGPSQGHDDLPPAYEPREVEDEDEDEDATVGDGSKPFSGPPGQVQLDIIRDMKDSPLATGDSWFLVARSWYRRWMTACSGTSDSKEDVAGPNLTCETVGSIDNSSIADRDGKLKQPVQDGVDIELLPETAYNLLREWYGSVGPDFERTVVSTGEFAGERIEFYPPTFQVFLLCPTDSSATSPVSVPSLDSAPTTSLASSTPFSVLKDFAARSFSLGRPVRLWRLPEAGDAVSASEGPAFVLSDKLRESGVELLDLPDETTLDEGLLSDAETRIAVEQQKPDGTWLVDAEAVLAAIAGLAEPLPPLDDAVEPSEPSNSVNVLEPRKKAGMFAGGWSAGLHKAKSASNGASGPTSAENAPATASGSGTSLMSSITGALTRSKAGQAKVGQRGLTGLQNLGNTCFMNSAIQCMSNTKELKDYFLSGAYKDELNPDNPLGMQGEVAEAFGDLIERMWNGSGGSVAPRQFKKAVARFAPQFSGYGQQDSQELLAFLLDGTHEDLNRIKKKPATSAPDWEGGGDKELVEMAKTCWEQYRSRNDSVIVDLFQGQYRSTVVCPDCDKVSITFDPFMYVTTNLPVTKKWLGTVYVVPLDPARSVISLELEVPKNGTVKTLKSCVGKLLDMDPKRLVTTEEWHGKFFKDWPDDEMVTEINTKNDKIVMYEAAGTISQPRFRKQKAASTTEDPDAPVYLVVVHKKSTARQGLKKTYGSFGGSSDYFGSPFVLSLTKDEASTVAGIQRAIARQYTRVTKLGDELVEAVEAELASSTSPATGDPAVNESTATALAEPADGTATPSTPMDVDGQAAGDSSSSSTPLTASTSSLAPPVPSTGESTPARRSALFTIEVSKRRRDVSTLLPMNQSAFQAEMEPLSNRAAAVARASATANEDLDMFSPTAAEGASAADAPEPSEPAEPPIAAPLVKTGDYVECEWEATAHEYFFGAEASRWEVTEDVVDPAVTSRKALGKQKQSITLDQCLIEFTKEERLGEDDMWYCSACKDFKQATKKVEIWKAPDVLVFALKRFSSGRYSRDKIDDFVDFPLEGFDMEPFVEGDKVERRLAEEMGEGNAPAISEPDSLLYDLYAVSNHFGGLGGGHYTAFAKNPDNNKWYDFDDSRVSPLSDATRAVSSSAYLLFYRRRTARPIGGAKSISAVESALQSRVNSAAPSLGGSAMGSPFGSRENLPSTLNMSTSADSGDNEGLLSGFTSYGEGTAMPGSFHTSGGGGGFMGMFQPRTTYTGGASTPSGGTGSVNENEPPSPKSLLDGDDENEGRREEELNWDSSSPPRRMEDDRDRDGEALSTAATSGLDTIE